MWRINLISAGVLGGLLFLSLGAAASQAAGPPATAAQVQSSLDRLSQWLAGSENGDDWQSYLKLEDLKSQLDHPAAADPLAVRHIADRFSRNAAELNKPQFVAVREALRTWVSQLPPIPVEQLPEAARQAKQEFDPVTEQEVKAARGKLATAAAALNRYIGRYKQEKDRDAWRKFLQLNDLDAQLASSEAPDLRLLFGVRERFFQNQEGLELKEFTAVRTALDTYLRAAQFSASDKAREEMDKRLDDLATRLEAFAAKPTTDEAAAIGATLGWLDQFGQAGSLVSAVRGHYRQPNMLMQISEDFLKAGVETAVDDHMPVRETILGTSIRGKAHTTGNVSLEVEANQARGAMRITLDGVSRTSNVGYNGPVTIYSTGKTDVLASAMVFLTENGMVAEPAEAECSTSTHISSINAKHKMVRKIAARRVASSKGQAERIASQKAARRVAGRMDDQVEEMLAEGNERFQSKFRKPLLRRDGFPQKFEVSSSDDAVNVSIVQAGIAHLAAFQQPLELPKMFDVAARFHETFVANFSEAAIGGVTMTDVDLAKMMEDATGEVPEELKITDEKEPWQITFADRHPIEARFGDNRVTISINGKAMKSGARSVRRAVTISATYNVNKTPAGAKLVRDGEVVVEYTNPGRQSAEETATKAVMKVKFEALFKPEIDRTGIKLKGRWEKAGELKLDHMQFGNGWTALGWVRVTSAKPETVATLRR